MGRIVAAPSLTVSYAKRNDGRKRAHIVIWRVDGGERHDRGYSTKRAADVFVRQLRTWEATRGTVWDTATGLPVEEATGITVAAYARKQVLAKWDAWLPNSREGVVKGLVWPVTMLVRTTSAPPAGLRDFVRLRWLHPGELLESDAVYVKWLDRYSLAVSVITKDLADNVLTAQSKRLDGQPAAASTTHQRQNAFKALLADAVEDDLLEKVPVSRKRTVQKLSKAKVGKTKLDPRVLFSEEDFAKVAANIDSDLIAGALAVSFYAGCRPEEVLAICAEEVELPSTDDSVGWLTLRGASYSHISKRYRSKDEEAGPLKDRAEGDVRKAPISPALGGYLGPLLAERSDGLLFSTDGIEPLPMRTIQKEWQAARESVFAPGDPKFKSRWYDLRHSCASRWCGEHITPPRVAQWLGHSLTVLYSTYAHALEETLDTDVRKLLDA